MFFDRTACSKEDFGLESYLRRYSGYFSSIPEQVITTIMFWPLFIELSSNFILINHLLATMIRLITVELLVLPRRHPCFVDYLPGNLSLTYITPILNIREYSKQVLLTLSEIAVSHGKLSEHVARDNATNKYSFKHLYFNHLY